MFLIRWIQIILPMAVLALAVVVMSYEPSVVRRLQNYAFDTYQEIRPRAYRPAPINATAPALPAGVRIVDIDEESLQRLGQWPWPRTVIAHMVQVLLQRGARAIAFDMVFAEPDRTSPRLAYRSWADTPETRQIRPLLERMDDHDEILAAVIANKPVVLGVVATKDETPSIPGIKWGYAFGAADAGQNVLNYLPRFPGAVINIEVLDRAASGNGTFNMVSDADGVVRSLPLLLTLDSAVDESGAPNALFPALAAESLRLAQGAGSYIIKSVGASGEPTFGSHGGLSSVKVGEVTIPVDRMGRMRLYDSGHVPERYVPAWQVVFGEFDPDLIKDHIVLIGASAAGLRDQRTTPLQPIAAGVEIHAQLIEQMLAGDYLRRPDWVLGAEVLFMGLLGITLTLLLRRSNALWCGVIGLAAIAAAISGSWVAFSEFGVLIDPVVPSGALALIYVSGSLSGYLKSERQRARLRTAFGQYIDPEMIAELTRNPDRLKLGGETKEMTVLFCDVRGFTSISEAFKSAPQELTTLISRLLTPLSEAVLSNKGTIDKFMGDCIMAFWNAPLDVHDHALCACRAALSMFEKVEVLNEQLQSEDLGFDAPLPEFRIGIGINTGECVVGNLGSEQRFDYSVLGDTANLASRLEGQSKAYGPSIVLGPKTAAQVRNQLATLEIEIVMVKGRNEPVTVSLLLGDETVRNDPQFHDLENKHRKMMAAYRDQDWSLALSLIEEIREAPLAPQGVYDLYEERIAEQKRRQAEAFREYTVDPLTGVHNRFYYGNLAQREAQRARRTGWAVTEIIFDILDFDTLNRTCGRVGGDKALKQFASICSETIRDSDILGRIGDHRFATTLPDCSPDQASVVAKRIQHKAEQIRIHSEGGDHQVSVTFTVSALTNEDDESPQELDVASVPLGLAR